MTIAQVSDIATPPAKASFLAKPGVLGLAARIFAYFSSWWQRPLRIGNKVIVGRHTDAMEVLSIKPGLTGLWQVRGRSRLTYARRKRFDLFLVRRFSSGLYFRIVMLTIPDVLFGRNAW